MHEKYKIGSVVLGYVTGIKEYGIFVQLDNNTSGLIHISEISNKYIESIDDYATIGELIRVRIVREEKDKNYIYYEINATVFEEMLLYFKSFLGGNNDVEE